MTMNQKDFSDAINAGVNRYYLSSKPTSVKRREAHEKHDLDMAAAKTKQERNFHHVCFWALRSRLGF